MCPARGDVDRMSLMTIFAVVNLINPGPARAETLYGAFQAACSGNPTLAAQRTAVKVSYEDKALAETGYAPAINGTLNYGYQDLKGQSPTDPLTDSKTHPRGYGVDLSQNIWNGFRTFNSVRREDASLQASRERLADVEQKVLLDVAIAYTDVLRDRSIIALQHQDLAMLQERAKQTRYRFTLGDLTQTDVDQSEASLARSRADLTVAESNLESSAASFRLVTGHEPGELDAAEVPDRLIPANAAAAVSAAQVENPAILAARNAAEAAELNVDVEKAGFAPSLDLTASAGHRYDPDNYPAKTDLVALSVIGKLTIPLYDRGVTYASVSRASELSSQRSLELDRQRDDIRANVVQSRGSYIASKLVIASADAQIAASERALYGVELEQSAGQRTTLDVLTSQRSLFEARVNRQIAQHDRIVAGYRLLAAIGRLRLSDLTPADTTGRQRRLEGLRRTLSPPTRVLREGLGLRLSFSETKDPARD